MGLAVRSGSYLNRGSSSGEHSCYLAGKPSSSNLCTLSHSFFSISFRPFFLALLDVDSKSDKINSVYTISISLKGSRFLLSSTWTMFSPSKHLTKCKTAFTALMLLRNLLPNPAPSLAPLIKPAMSHISI